MYRVPHTCTRYTNALIEYTCTCTCIGISMYMYIYTWAWRCMHISRNLLSSKKKPQNVVEKDMGGSFHSSIRKWVGGVRRIVARSLVRQTKQNCIFKQDRWVHNRKGTEMEWIMNQLHVVQSCRMCMAYQGGGGAGKTVWIPSSNFMPPSSHSLILFTKECLQCRSLNSAIHVWHYMYNVHM